MKDFLNGEYDDYFLIAHNILLIFNQMVAEICSDSRSAMEQWIQYENMKSWNRNENHDLAWAGHSYPKLPQYGQD